MKFWFSLILLLFTIGNFPVQFALSLMNRKAKGSHIRKAIYPMCQLKEATILNSILGYCTVRNSVVQDSFLIGYHIFGCHITNIHVDPNDPMNWIRDASNMRNDFAGMDIKDGIKLNHIYLWIDIP